VKGAIPVNTNIHVCTVHTSYMQPLNDDFEDTAGKILHYGHLGTTRSLPLFKAVILGLLWYHNTLGMSVLPAPPPHIDQFLISGLHMYEVVDYLDADQRTVQVVINVFCFLWGSGCGRISNLSNMVPCSVAGGRAPDSSRVPRVPTLGTPPPYIHASLQCGNDPRPVTVRTRSRPSIRIVKGNDLYPLPGSYHQVIRYT
jgi:hypothetical protein